MISIIVVGKNEGWKLTACFESISKLMARYPDLDFELIYVDSKSEDDSVARVRRFNGVHIYELEGEVNSAIARNVGASNATGEIFFFIDGDMEILPDFLGHAIKDGHLVHDILTGHVDDCFYDFEGRFISRVPRTYTDKVPSMEEELLATGGLMVVSASVWKSVEGMQTKYKRSQDLDLCLRLRKKGIKLYRLPHLLAKHHTVSYSDKKRMWKNFFQGYSLYPALLLREHFMVGGYFVKSLRANYGAFFLLLSLLPLMISHIFGLVSLTAYFTFVLVYVSYKIFREREFNEGYNYFMLRFFNKILSDLGFLVGFVFFYPRKKKGFFRKVS